VCLSRLPRGRQETLAGCLQDLAVRSLLPALEGRVRALNHQARPLARSEPPVRATGSAAGSWLRT